MKKAQAEMIGLVVIVILFIFIGLIYVMFTGKSDEGSLTRDVTQTGKVQNMLDAFVQITPCYDKQPYEQMSLIIKNCYIASEELTCGVPCKELITKTLQNLMKSYNLKQEYEFEIKGSKDEEFLKEGKCKESTTTPTATERIVSGGQAITLRLTYCIK